MVTALAGGLSIGAALLGERWIDPEGGGIPLAGLGQGEPVQWPEIRLPDLAGHEHSSDTWSGHPLILNFWAAWCPPCLEELPRLERFAQRHADAGIRVVAIAVDRPEATRAFLAAHPVDLTILLAELETITLTRRLGNRVEGLPFTVAFDARGRHVFSHLGALEQDQFEQLAARLDAPSATPR
nr:TlpA disulfide reductase family protein [Marichromatium bheemlicum]